MRVEVVSELSALEALREEWDALADRFQTPLLRWAWVAAAARTYAAGEQLAVFTVRRDGRLAAAAPLVVDRSGVVPRLRLLAFQDREPDAFLYEDQPALEALCRAVLGAGRPLVMPRLDPDSAEWAALQRESQRHGLAVLRPGTNSYYCTRLAESAAAFEAAMDSRKRARLRRMRTGLEKHGPVSFEVLTPAEGEVDALVDELARVEAASWKGRTGGAMALRPDLDAFVREHARLAAREGMLLVSRLRLDGDVIAAHLDILCGGRIWGQKMGADERWAKYGPGILANHELMKWASDRGLVALEHLGTAEDWQRRWPHAVRRFGTFRFYPRRAAAALALGADAAAYALRGALARGRTSEAQAA